MDAKFLHIFLDLVGQLNKRTQYALIALGFIVGIVGILEMSDHTLVLRTERIGVEKRLAQYGDGLDETLWSERLQTANNVSLEWDQYYWEGQTAGLIAAQIQSRLAIIGAGTLLESLRVDVPPDVIALPDGNQALRFQLNARSSDAIDLINAITEISANQPALGIQEINLNVRDNKSGVIQLSGFARFVTTTPDSPTANEATP